MTEDVLAREAAPPFTHALRPGPVGVVGPAAAGAQEAGVRVHDFGGGVSRIVAIPGAGRDDDAVATAIVHGLQALEADAATEATVLVVRAPGAAVEDAVAGQVARCAKPVVVCAIGGSPERLAAAGARAAGTTKEAALQAVLLTGLREEDIDLHALNWPLIHEVRAKLGPEQRYVRGLFCGGDLCAEAMAHAMERYDDVHGNAHPDPARRIDLGAPGVAHTFRDYGGGGESSDAARAERLVAEAADPEVGVVVFDVLLGSGAGADPVGRLLPAIAEARARAAADGRHLELLGYVQGTDLDTPSVGDQVAGLDAAGVTIASSSANTGLLAREFAWKD